jgi:hybrid cluster-associated redox disulfide protein
MPMKITEDMIIGDVLKKNPSSKKVFEKYLPRCHKCGGKGAESIRRGAKLHGVDLDELVKALNHAAKPRKKK